MALTGDMGSNPVSLTKKIKKHTSGDALCVPLCATIRTRGDEMEIVKTPLFLDVSNTQTQQTVVVKQYDTARELHITFTDGGRLYGIKSDCLAVFAATKPDGHIILNSCKLEFGSVVYRFTTQTAIAAGIMPCEIKLYGADNTLLTSQRFFLKVERAEYSGDSQDIVESSDEFNALTELISRANSIVNRTFKAEAVTGEVGKPADVQMIFDSEANTVTYRFTLPTADIGEETRTAITENTAARHTHGNKETLDGITGEMSTLDIIKIWNKVFKED